jgi:hypothetical protein
VIPDTAALHRAEADLEAALVACRMAVDSEGRRIILFQRIDPLGTERYSPQAIAEIFFRFVTHADTRGSGEVERRWVINARLLLNAWEAAIHYETVKCKVEV